MIATLTLKYLFCAKLKSGEIIEQTHEDVSMERENKNAYYDLLEKAPDGEPIIVNGTVQCRSDVELFQMEDEATRYLVDLNDGHFEVQLLDGELGIPFFIKIPPKDATLRPFRFLRRRHHFNFNGDELGQECEYHFGWETEDGKERAEIILI